MNIRFTLRNAFDDPVVRDVRDGLWAEPEGEVDHEVGADLWALPGLVDAHAHLAAAELSVVPGDIIGARSRAAAALAAGVNLVFDKGWTDDTAIRLVDEMSPDERPDMEAAARIITTEGGYFPEFGVVADKATLAAAVTAEVAAGRGWVKLIGDWPRRGIGPVSNFEQSDLEVAVGIAEAAGARVAIHAMARDTPAKAVAAGVHSIEHGLFLSEDDLGGLGARSGMWVPTVLRTEATAAQLGADSSGRRLLSEGLAGLRRLLPLAVEAGVMVLTGTDLIGEPRDVAAEALRLAALGLSNRQVVAAVSTNGYLATGRDPRFTPGTSADAVFFAAPPWDDLAVLAHPRVVMRRGRVL